MNIEISTRTLWQGLRIGASIALNHRIGRPNHIEPEDLVKLTVDEKGIVVESASPTATMRHTILPDETMTIGGSGTCSIDAHVAVRAFARWAKKPSTLRIGPVTSVQSVDESDEYAPDGHCSLECTEAGSESAMQWTICTYPVRYMEPNLTGISPTKTWLTIRASSLREAMERVGFSVDEYVYISSEKGLVSVNAGSSRHVCAQELLPHDIVERHDDGCVSARYRDLRTALGVLHPLDDVEVRPSMDGKHLLLQTARTQCWMATEIPCCAPLHVLEFPAKRMPLAEICAGPGLAGHLKFLYRHGKNRRVHLTMRRGRTWIRLSTAASEHHKEVAAPVPCMSPTEHNLDFWFGGYLDKWLCQFEEGTPVILLETDKALIARPRDDATYFYATPKLPSPESPPHSGKRQLPRAGAANGGGSEYSRSRRGGDAPAMMKSKKRKANK